MKLLDLSTWWQSMQGFEKIFWVIALLFSLLFLVQTILSFTSGDGSESFGDAEEAVGDDSGIAHGFFTIKNMIAFFTIFGWTGIALIKGNTNKAVTIGVAILAGTLVVFMMMLLFRSMSRLRQSGTLQVKNAIGSVAETYLVIPASRGGLGKVHVKVQGSLHELQALTDDELQIATGKLVKVLDVINDSILLVTTKLS
ncbi:MAG TPA: hypothetical protein VFX58_16700 [Chitinophagaceae bacterium]|nr:hypothetical protein [Chitinophagaceae bacterium]